MLITGVFLSEIADRRLVLEQPSAEWYAWVSNLVFSAGLVLFIFIPLLLPGGNLPSPRWRIVAAAGAVAAGTWVATSMFAPGVLMEVAGLEKPLGIEALEGFFDVTMTVLGPIVFAVPLLGIVSLIWRARRSSGAERQQMKWIAVGGATIVATIGALWLVERVFGDLSDAAATPFIIVMILAFPVTIGVAILRHRLYDVDVIINRTLVYGALTAILLGAYLVIVFGLSRLLDPVTRDSDIAVAGSTLVVAALFRPLRARIQAFIDRRFYRAKYDGARALGEFGTRLRNEVELDLVRADVLGVVGATLQPKHVSLWIKPGAAT